MKDYGEPDVKCKCSSCDNDLCCCGTKLGQRRQYVEQTILQHGDSYDCISSLKARVEELDELVNLSEIQLKVYEWQTKNFGNSDRSELRTALGVCEEAGELAHAVLKKDQGIRGTTEEHEDAMKDAIGDTAIFMMNLCAMHGWDFPTVVQCVALEVIKREWKK